MRSFHPLLLFEGFKAKCRNFTVSTGNSFLFGGLTRTRYTLRKTNVFRRGPAFHEEPPGIKNALPSEMSDISKDAKSWWVGGRYLILWVGIWTATFMFLWAGVRRFIEQPWPGFQEATSYAVFGRGGRCLAVIFLPRNRVLMLVADTKEHHFEGVLATMEGTVENSVFLRLRTALMGPYSASSARSGCTPRGEASNSSLESQASAIVLRMTVLKKDTLGRTDPAVFLNPGDKYTIPILLTPEALCFGSVWMAREPVDAALLEILSARMKEDLLSNAYTSKQHTVLLPVQTSAHTRSLKNHRYNPSHLKSARSLRTL